MIPYSILQGELIYDTGETADVCVSELSPDYAVIRLPSGFTEKNGFPVKSLFWFYIWKEQRYTECHQDNCTFEPYGGNEFAEYLKIGNLSAEFRQMASVLTKEYMRYINLKLNYDSTEISSELTEGRYPDSSDEKYNDSPDDLNEKWIKTVEKNGMKAMLTPEIYFSVEKPERKKAFLTGGRSGFPFGADKIFNITGVYAGNSYCTSLFPEAEELKRTAEKAFEENLKLIVSVPPVSESFRQQITESVLSFAEYYQNSNDGENRLVYQFNDTGMLLWVREKLAGYSSVLTESGVLLFRYKRDPRRKYLAGKESRAFNLMVSENTVFGPYYQTNTGTFCPLYAYICRGSRGNQIRVRNCDKYCEKYFFQYPEHLNLKWEGNSLFGWHEGFLTDSELSSVINRFKRLVINI